VAEPLKMMRLLGTPIRLIQKSSEHADESQYNRNAISTKKSCRSKRNMLGKVNPSPKTVEFDFDISRWSTSTINDDSEIFRPVSVQNKRDPLELADLKVKDTNKISTFAEPIIPKETPVYNSILTRASQLASPFYIPSTLKTERKTMIRTEKTMKRTSPPLVARTSEAPRAGAEPIFC
jgi:hypothetical protein